MTRELDEITFSPVVRLLFENGAIHDFDPLEAPLLHNTADCL